MLLNPKKCQLERLSKQLTNLSLPIHLQTTTAVLELKLVKRGWKDEEDENVS